MHEQFRLLKLVRSRTRCPDAGKGSRTLELLRETLLRRSPLTTWLSPHNKKKRWYGRYPHQADTYRLYWILFLGSSFELLINPELPEYSNIESHPTHSHIIKKTGTIKYYNSE